MCKEGVAIELLRYAFNGVNIIPTLLLILVFLYWFVAILGALDLEFLDIDLEGVDGAGPFYSLSVLLNIGRVPFGLVISLLVINFWMLSMLVYLIPIEVEGPISILVLVPPLIASFFVTKVELIPLRVIFKGANLPSEKETKVMGEYCEMMCDLEGDRLGQARIRRDGAALVINVKVEVEGQSFEKNEVVMVSSKDKEKNIYYIRKSRG